MNVVRDKNYASKILLINAIKIKKISADIPPYSTDAALSRAVCDDLCVHLDPHRLMIVLQAMN